MQSGTAELEPGHHRLERGWSEVRGWCSVALEGMKTDTILIPPEGNSQSLGCSKPACTSMQSLKPLGWTLDILGIFQVLVRQDIVPEQTVQERQSCQLMAGSDSPHALSLTFRKTLQFGADGDS